MNIREWLNTEPELEDLIEVGNGAFTHPYDVIVRKLWTLCPLGWDTRNFQHQYVLMPATEQSHIPVMKVSGSIEVVVRFSSRQEVDAIEVSNPEVEIILSGAATFSTTDYSNEIETNEHYAATVKSLAIVNAVQVLGRQFGWGLNTNNGLSLPVQYADGTLSKQKFQKKMKAAVKTNPDEGMKGQWNEAVKNNNMKMVRFFFGMYNIIPGENGFAYINTDTDAS